MTRRRLLHSSAAIGALTTLAGCLDEDSNTDQSDDEESEENGSDGRPPFGIRTIDARGSESGEMSVPAAGTVLVVNFARTQCPTSERQVTSVAEANDEVDEESVTFLTVNDWTRGPADTDDELAEWWETDTDGDWLLGIDENGDANDYYDVVSFPVTMVIDGDGEVYWRDSGETVSSSILWAVDEALESEPENE